MTKVAKVPRAITSFRGRYYFLSNFYTCLVTYEGMHFPSSEHAFQAAKTFDPSARDFIAHLPTPGDAKRAGNALVLRSDWARVKIEVMYDILVDKFRNPDLEEALLATFPRELIEGNNHGDAYWGMVMSDGDWFGHNKLGKLLMRIRTELMEGG